MKKKMLQFVDLKQETPEKRNTIKEKVILMKFIMNYITDKAKNNQADVLNVEFHFVKYIVL
jgi:hypothetical protein